MNSSLKIVKVFLIVLVTAFFIKSSLLAQEKLHLENYDGIPGNSYVHDITLHNSQLWVSTNRGLFEINDKTNIVNAYHSGKSIQTICYIGKIEMIANKNKIINLNSKILYQFGIDVQIYQMVYYKSELWIGTNNGIYIINPKNFKEKEHYTVENSKLLSNDIKVLHKDKNNILWIGTKKGYIRITNKWEKPRNKKLEIYSISENREGVWLLNENELLFTFYDGRGNEIGLGEGLSKGKVKDIAVNNSNKIYIASEVLIGLDPYSDLSNNLGKEISLLSKQVTKMQFDKDDFLWVGTENSGLFKLTIEKLKKSKVNKDTIEQIEPLNAFILVANDIKCSGSQEGQLNVQPNGGTAPYSYLWSNNSTEKQILNLGDGKYEVTVTDMDKNSFVTNIRLSAPAPISILISDQEPTNSIYARDGKVTIDINGGTPAYQIEWDGKPGQATNSKLSNGTHTVVVTDRFGCVGQLEFEVTAPKILSALSMKTLSIGQTLPIKKLFFAADSSTIQEASYEVLDEIYEFMRVNNSVVIEIGGHTNNIPPHEYCNKLSTNRAKHVSSYLSLRGIPSERIKFRGYGKRRPIASNKTPGGRKKNQRVELKILAL